ncbi:MAG TPA: dipeptidase [Gemmatimonadaceae bacterium]|nr:dipeptidase [Gemmatimonadaceae bacterium]
MTSTPLHYLKPLGVALPSRVLPALAVLAVAFIATAKAQDPHLERARRVLRSVPLVDGHNDLPWYIRTEFRAAPRDVDAYDLRGRTPGNTDIPRLREGMVGAQFWSVYIPGNVRDSGFARMQLEQIDIARRVIARYPDAFQPAYTVNDVRKAFAAGKIASLLGMEGGHAIENSLGALRAYYDLGVRYMTLTHNVTTDWADAAADSARHGGLTEFGKEVVREMNRLGMLVDLSHVSPAVMSAALDVSEAPVIFSHSSARALTDVPRNVPDSILRRLPANGGVVMVTFVPGFVSQKVADHAAQRRRIVAEARRGYPGDSTAAARMIALWDASNPAPRATLSDVADHIEHVRRVAGVDHVGIGSDFDGTGNELPVGLEDVSRFPALLAELSRRGWTEADLEKLAGENVLRVMARAEEVARRLQRERLPSNRTIEELDRKPRR